MKNDRKKDRQTDRQTENKQERKEAGKKRTNIIIPKPPGPSQKCAFLI